MLLLGRIRSMVLQCKAIDEKIMGNGISMGKLNPFVSNAPSFSGVVKGCIGSEWVKIIHF